MRPVDWRRRMLLRAALLTVGVPIVRSAAAATGALVSWSNEPAPKLVLKDTNGATQDLAAYRGKAVLVNFWATWCEPCRHEMPSMERLREKLARKPFEVLTVNVDEPHARVRRFLKETGLDLSVLLDQNKEVTRAWSVRVLPTSFVVGPDGRTRYRVVGDIDWSADAVVRTIIELIDNRR